jgi:hypothetical protein
MGKIIKSVRVKQDEENFIEILIPRVIKKLIELKNEKGIDSLF